MRHSWLGLNCRGGCGRRLVRREAATTETEARHRGGGFCFGCRTAEVRAANPRPGSKRLSPARLQYLHDLRASFEADRARRGVPPEGLRWSA